MTTDQLMTTEPHTRVVRSPGRCRARLLLLVAGVVLLLTGCVTLTGEVDLDEQGTSSGELVYEIDQDVAAASGITSADDLTEQIEAEQTDEATTIEVETTDSTYRIMLTSSAFPPDDVPWSVSTAGSIQTISLTVAEPSTSGRIDVTINTAGYITETDGQYLERVDDDTLRINGPLTEAWSVEATVDTSRSVGGVPTGILWAVGLLLVIGLGAVAAVLLTRGRSSGRGGAPGTGPSSGQWGQPGQPGPGQAGRGQGGQPGQPGPGSWGQPAPGQPGPSGPPGHVAPGPWGGAAPGQPGQPGQPGPGSWGQPAPGQPPGQPAPGQPPGQPGPGSWGQTAPGQPPGQPGPGPWGQTAPGQPPGQPGPGQWGQTAPGQPPGQSGPGSWGQPAPGQPDGVDNWPSPPQDPPSGQG
ncbi:MAG: hypothetical protein ACK5PP_04130 [Acidimicrobiales bacterium]